MQTPSFLQILKNPIYFLAFGFGAGLAPKAPGTFGTIIAIPLFLVIAPLDLIAYCVLVLVLTVAGVWICGKASEQLGVHDHKGIVWDEIVGYLITMIAAPASLDAIIIGFLLFRLFDVLKPWPISWVDRSVQGGTGIMLDDVLAGVFAALALQGLLILFY